MRLALQLAGAVLLVTGAGFAENQKAKSEAAPKAAAKIPAPRPPANAGTPTKADVAPKKTGPPLNNPLNLVQRLSQLTPDQRERVLERLPPDRQAQVRQQLEKLATRPQAVKDLVARQFQSLNALPPAKQRLISQAINGMGRLPEDRKKPVRQELLTLLEMAPDDRVARLSSADFKKSYNSEEQRILSDLSKNLPPDYPMAGRR